MTIPEADEAALAAKFAVMRSSLDELAWRLSPRTEAGRAGLGRERGAGPAPAARLSCRDISPISAVRGWNSLGMDAAPCTLFCNARDFKEPLRTEVSGFIAGQSGNPWAGAPLAAGADGGRLWYSAP